MSVYTFLLLWSLLMFAIGFLITKEEAVIDTERNISLHRSSRFFALLSFFPIFAIAAFRSSVADTAAYISQFSSMPTEVADIPAYLETCVKSVGFFRLSCYIKCYISDDYIVYFAILSAIMAIGIIIPVRRYSSNFAFSLFLFVASAKFTWMLNGVKQFLAATIIFMFASWIADKKFFRWLIVVLLLYSIHSSCLVVIPFYFIVRGKPWNYKILLFLAVVLFAITFVGQFTNILSTALEDTEYEQYTESVLSDTGSNIMRVFIAGVPAVIALVKKKTVEEKAPQIINICINMSIVTAGLYLVSFITSGILIGRLPIYFGLYELILYPWLFDNCFDSDTRKILYVSCIILFSIYYYLEIGNWVYSSDFLNIHQFG